MNKLFPAFLAFTLMAASAFGQVDAEKPSYTLIQNVKIFDGRSESLTMGQDVLVEGNLIKRIGPGLPGRGGHRGRGLS